MDLFQKIVCLETTLPYSTIFELELAAELRINTLKLQQRAQTKWKQTEKQVQVAKEGNL